VYTSFSPSPSGLKNFTGDSKLKTGPSVSWGGGGGGGGGGGTTAGGGGGGGGLLHPAKARIIPAVTTNNIIFFIRFTPLNLKYTPFPKNIQSRVNRTQQFSIYRFKQQKDARS
jgi:hypothetical protein